MYPDRAVLIGFQEQENLGIGYLAAMLRDNGFQVKVLDFREKPERLYYEIKSVSPLFVGFSVIFQYYVQRFSSLLAYLRERNINCHFTAGGHYPSLRPEELLNIVQQLDSVVRFEGEYTLIELATKLSRGQNWKKTPGIAYRQDSRIVTTQLPRLVDDLDVLPFPMRTTVPITCLDKKCATIIASRGCLRHCSFCSIRKFYEMPPGKIRRLRSPKNVVREMKILHEEGDFNIFFFQDDDFPLVGKVGRRWIANFIKELDNQGLTDELLWKISCRPDEVDYSLFKQMREAGLFLVYLGIESGNDFGLRILNKGLTVDQHFKAVDILKGLRIIYDFGFMLFDPSSTFDSVRENLKFLQKLCGDGSSPAAFCKMIPYAATDIEEQLLKENRLKGNVYSRDYDFLDARLNSYYSFLKEIFGEWMFTNTGLLNKLKWSRYETAIIEKYYPGVSDLSLHKAAIRNLVVASNETYFTVAEELVNFFLKSDVLSSQAILTEFQHLVLNQQQCLTVSLLEAIKSFYVYNGFVTKGTRPQPDRCEELRQQFAMPGET